ncbi:hypothetical protein [Pseudoduganella umbonata]|uniref:Uncharacterized protein n=1 Tax=Pseudoduganella umbonata TaxID=864828 RepID=A0A4P8HVW6_9BURK|nr:hypothetical protein [Pseudoduganella umbonata]MBB3223974.1 hypothetical protein [Pseudoduganella umbonata]QCP14143.1 hypothetical protein FCL38_29820 [Pseudoduganella umbonata]
MNDMDMCDTELVVTVLQALQDEMTADLADLEHRIGAVPEVISIDPAHTGGKLEELRSARTALHSGLASIREVLGWIEWITENDPEGETSVAAQPLPTALGFPIH